MTSTNDGKDVKSNQTSGHKSKSYYIELYTSLEKALSGNGSLEERTAHVCEAWRRVYCLYQHSATSTHPHLLSWLQRHTANTVLQSKWAKSKNEQTRLTNAIDALVAEATAAAAGREQHPWEKVLLQRAAWFRKAVENPWDNPVLKSLINPNSEPVTDEQVLEWLISEHGVVLVTRLQRMVGAGNCDDLALLLASAVMDRARAAIPRRADDRADERVEEEDRSSFVAVLEREASFTSEDWEMLTDIELVLLLKTDKRPRCIELAKLTPLRHGYKMVERLRKRLEMFPRDKKLWKHAKEAATLVAQMVIARCMVVGVCGGSAREALYWCARALARLVGAAALRPVGSKLAAPATTARHLHTFCAALIGECKELKTEVIMMPFICELYVRAINSGIYELEKLKLIPEKEAEARLYEQTLAGWYMQLGGRLTDSARLRAECSLTAFSVHPSEKHYQRVASTPQPPGLQTTLEPTPETTSEYGSWANDSRTQSNLVKTSETLQLKQSQQHQANVLSTAILTEGEALGLETVLCQDLAVILSGPRVKTLSWDMDREVLLENCRTYMEKTHGGTRAVTTELKYLNLDPEAYRHLPEEGDDESDLYYGIEKGYEHEVQFEEPEDIWQNGFFDPEQTLSANDSEVDQLIKKKTKANSSEDDEDPLSNIAEAKREKKKQAKEKRKESRKKSHKRDESKDGSRERRKDKEKKTKKERKKKSEQPTPGSLTCLLGMKVSKMSAIVQDGEKRVRKKKERRRELKTMFSYVSVTDSDYDSQVKPQVSEHDPNVLVDGVFSMDEHGTPEKTIDSQKPIDSTKTTFNNAPVQSPVIKDNKTRPMSSPYSTASDSDVSRAKSPYLTPNQLGPRHVVGSKVKSSIAKLLQFRRNKSQVRDVPRPPPSRTPTNPTHSLVGMKIYKPEDVSKVYLNQTQSKQLDAIAKEVSDLFKETSSSVNYRTAPETDRLQNQNLYNVQKYQQQYGNPRHMPQTYNESQKHSEYTQHSPIRPAHQVSSQSPTSVIHTNYTSPIKAPEHMRTHALNLSPPKPTVTYHPFHKSMQNLSTETKYDPPKKPQLINDPNYFSQQLAKSNSSPLSPRIISNTCIKPPSQTPIKQYSAPVKDNTTKSPQTYSNMHGTNTSRGPAQTHNQATDSKKDVIRYVQKQLSSSMQNISEVPRRYDAIKSHIPTPNTLHGQAAKPYSVKSQNDALNKSQALYKNTKNTTASRCLPIQHRERADKTPQKSNIHFEEYLKELVKSISESNGHDKNRTVALNKHVKVTPVPSSTATAKRVDSVTSQCAKQLIQQKKTENVPNTFSRRSYNMHKNKQSENKVSLTDSITLELNRTMMDHKISKAKCMKNEVTISRVGPNKQDPGNVIRKLEQPCSRSRECPVLSSMLDASPKIKTVSNTANSNTPGNQPNREDANLLLLLRNQTVLKQNASTTAALASDTSGQALNNSQIKVEVSSAHQSLVGTKVKSEPEEDKGWKHVMDAIIAQKTEPLGPNALDLALKKQYSRNSQSISRAHSSDKHRVSGQTSLHNKPVDPKKREPYSSKASSSSKLSTEKHSEAPKKPREPEIMKKTTTEMLNRPEILNKQFSSTIPKDVPQTPVIQNSDYDILDELIDDDLRRELWELSSDEDSYSASNAALLKGKTQSNIPKTVPNVYKAANISKGKPHIVNPKTMTIPKNPNVADCNRRLAVNTCPATGYPNVINNSSHPTHITNKPTAINTETRLRIGTSTIITNQVAQDTANNVVTSHIGANQFMGNVLPANVILASVPQAPVVVIRQDLVYDPYPTIRIHESQVNADLCTVNKNMYALNATPNIAVYQTTQYAAPVINPFIIGNAMTTTNVSNATAMGNDHDTPDRTKDMYKEDQDSISLEDAIRLTDSGNLSPEKSTKRLEATISHSDDRSLTPEITTNLDFNMNRNCERKVLSQVQEKHPNDNVDKESLLKKSPDDDIPFKSDEERIKLKRQSLLNRKISHAVDHPTIPLTYTPVTRKINLEKQLQRETPKNGIVKHDLISIPNSTSDIQKSIVISASEKSPQSEANIENIQATEQASSVKENQKSCSRIWLRSSNKIRNKVSPVKRSRVPLRRDKIKPKVSVNEALEKIAYVESENKDSVKNPKRVSNRILNKVKGIKPATNQPPSQEALQQNVAHNDELIDFEEALSGTIVLKSPTTMFRTENTTKETTCNSAKIEKEEFGAAVDEQHKNLNSIEDTKVINQSNKTSDIRLEPMVVIEKLKCKLGAQLIIKRSSVKTPVNKAKVIVIKKNRPVLTNKSIIKNINVPIEATSNKIIIKEAHKNTDSAAAVPDNTNKLKPVVIDHNVRKAKPISTSLVHVETNKLVDQKVIEHTSAVRAPIPLDDNNKLKPVLDDQNEASKLNLPVAEQKVTELITAASSQPVIETTAKANVKVIEATATGLEKTNKKPIAVDDQKVIKRTRSSRLPVIEDETDTLKSTAVDNRDVVNQTSSVELPLDLNESNKSKPRAMGDQELIKHTESTPESSTTEQKRHGNDSPDCIKLEKTNKKPIAVDDQKVIKRTRSSRLPVIEDETDTLKSIAVDNRDVVNQTSSVELPLDLNESNKSKPRAMGDQELIKHTESTPESSTTEQIRHGNDSPDCIKLEKTNKKPLAVDDQKVIKQTRSSRLPVIEDETDTLKSTAVNNRDVVNQTSSVELPLDLNESNKSKPRAMGDQELIKHTESTPESSTTEQKRHDNDSPDCIKATELEVKKQSQTDKTNSMLSTDSEKTSRALETKPSATINKANKIVQSDRIVNLLSFENSTKINAESTKFNETGFKPTCILSPQTSDGVINHVSVTQNNSEEVIDISETDDVQSTTEVLKNNSNYEITNKDQQIDKSLSFQENIKNLNDDAAPKSDVGQENVKQMNKLREQLNILSKPDNPNDDFKQGELKALDNTKRPVLTSAPNNKKSTLIKGDIKVVELPVVNSNDPSMKLVRITLPNGKVFRATITGNREGKGIQVDYDYLFSDPGIRAILSGSLNEGKRYTVNYKQVSKLNKTNPTKPLDVQIQNLNVKEAEVVATPIDTVNLVSDDEDEVPTPPTRSFTTEFGKYTTNTDAEICTMHQNKFNQKCEVKMYREDIFKSNKTKPRNVPSVSTLLTRNKSKLLYTASAQVVSSTETNVMPEVVSYPDISTQAQETHILAKTTEVDNVIEIDDSSNDSIDNPKLKTVNDINLEPVKKLVELKSLLLSDLGVGIEKNITFPVPKEKAVNNLKSALLQDLGLVTAEDPVIDITADDEKQDETLTESHKQNECLDNNPVDDITQNEEKKVDILMGIQTQNNTCFVDDPVVQNERDKKTLTERQEQDNLLKCVVKLVNCDNLIKKYERMKTMKKCYVKLERLNNSTLKVPIISQNEKTNEEVTDEMEETDKMNLDTDDFINFDDEEPSGSPQLSRFPSLSILNNWDDDSQPLEIACPTSPVMEIYETIAQLRNTLKIELVRHPEKLLSLTCDSEWRMTKPGYSIEERLLRSSNISSLESKIVPDNDNVLVGCTENLVITFDAPKLVTITLKFLENNPDVLCRLESMRSLRRILNTKTSQNKLKRKTEELVSDTVASKILKLGTLALNSLNSCFMVLDGVRFSNIEDNVTAQPDVSSINNESSNHVIIESLPKASTTVENIEDNKLMDDSVTTLNFEFLVAECEIHVCSSPSIEAPVNEDNNADLLKSTLIAESNITGDRADEKCKEDTQNSQESQLEKKTIDQCDNKEYSDPIVKVTVVHEEVNSSEETVRFIEFPTRSTGNRAEDEDCKEGTPDSNCKPDESKTDLDAQCENYEECVSPVSVALIDEGTTGNAEEIVAIADSNTSFTVAKIEENDKGGPEKNTTPEYAQFENNEECLTSPIIDSFLNEDTNAYSEETAQSVDSNKSQTEHKTEEISDPFFDEDTIASSEETVQIVDSDTSPTDHETEEKYDQETNYTGNFIYDISKEQSVPVHREPILVPGECETIEIEENENKPANANLSVKKSVSYLLSESSWDKNFTEDIHIVESLSPLSTSAAGDTESQISVNVSDEQTTTKVPHTVNSDRLDEISIDEISNDFYEVEVVETHIDDRIDIVELETLLEKSEEPTTVTTVTNADSSEVHHQDSAIISPDFIDSKNIAFNYHDYTKQPKKKEDVTTSTHRRPDCEVNNDKDLLTECASETDDYTALKVDSKENSCRKDTRTNHTEVNTSENCPLKLKPELKYELIQEDDLLTVRITTENDKDDNETKTVFINDAEEETVASLSSDEADDNIDIKGFELEDMYVFPLNQSATNSNNTSSDSLGQESNSESVNDTTLNDLHDIDFHVIEPEITYSRKRKIDMRDIRVPAKKYRKGKNIDCSKQTVISMAELAYGKEYKRLLEYCSSVKFSYTRPFHKECVDIDDLMTNWPINFVSCDVQGDISEDHLFVDLHDISSYQPDPMTQTFVEEINYEYDRTDAAPENPSSEASEVNFNMGFGEGSGRVIQILKESVSNISAATLSDVKQSQPVFKSVDLDDCNYVTTKKEDQIKKIRQYVNFIELRDKVRTFFKKSSDELKSDWLQKTKDLESKCHYRFSREEFPFDLCSLDYVKPLPTNAIVQVVQVGQLPVSAAAQNPVTCDPRVTQVSDASPSQCSVDNSPNDDSQSEIKTEYTELTTADLSLPLQGYAQQNQANLASNDSNLEITEQTISLEMEIKAEKSPEIKKEMPDIKEEKSNSSDTDLHTLTNASPENMDYSFETSMAKSDVNSVAYDSSEQNSSETFSQQRQQNGTTEKTDQIAHAMNAAGITTTPETVTNTRAHALVNILSQKIRQGSVNTTQTTTNTYSKTTSINAMALQQALAQILPPPLNQTGSSENSQAQSTAVGPQVLHIVQGKNASGNQITLVDNSQQSVISTPNATQVLHIVQNKNSNPGQASNGTLTSQGSSFSGLSLVDAGLQQGGNQLLHIVNTGNQKNASPGQLLKRVNLLTNLTNVQGSNEQKMVQFVCKSADGKAIQLNAPHQRSMVLRLQPIETPNVQTPPAKPAESQEPSPAPTGSASSKESASQQEIKSRSIYEENYAKFIQNSSSKTPGLEKSTSLPKFNQAFGKPVFQEGQKQGEAANNNSHLPPVNTNTENTDCSDRDNAINLEHIRQISSPPLLLRKQPVVTSASQPNIVQQIKQTIAPMNIQTMHGGVIYTRQIPVNIGGGQTINLITVPSTELINDDSSKSQAQNNQGEIEPSIIKIVPQSQTPSHNESSQDESNNHASGSNENAQTPQPQPVLTQMRIKLPMLSKAPQMVPGARVVRPSFFQIQRNVLGGNNQPVYQQLVLTAAPPLGQQTIRLPQAQASRPLKAPSESQSSSSESQMSTSTLEQLREFDMVLEQVKERSTVQPSTNSNNSSFKIHTTSSDTTDGNGSSNCSTESTPQVLYSIGNNQSLNVTYVNRKASVTTPTTSTYVRSPDSSGIADSPTSSTHGQIPHIVTTDSSPTEMSQSKPAKVGSKSKSRPKSTSNPPNTLKLSSVPPKTSTQKPLEDEQTTQRILYILAEYKEQVENSPDKDKPAPRRRSNPPSNPGSSKRKKSSSSRRSGTRDMSPIHGEDTCRTMGSEDSSCGTSQGDCTESCLDSHSPQDSPRKVARKITFDQDLTVTQPRPQPQRNVIVADGQTITVARGTTGKPATAVLMPANYILPVSMMKGGQQIAIVTNRGPKLLTVGGEGGATNALLLQRLIGPAGLKPVLTRPGVRHVRLPTAALHNLQAFNLATATAVQPPDSTASPTPGPTPPELVDTRATSSPWTDRGEVKPERGSSPEGSEPWNLPSSADAHEYTYEETVRTDNMDRTVLDPIPDRYSPDMEAQRIFDKMFDVDSKKPYAVDSHDDSPRCAYDIDPSDCDDKAYQVVQKKDGSHRQHRLSHVSAAALRHKYAILEHELRLQKSLSEECEDLGVDSPSASELFPEAELLFAASPAHEHNQEHHSHTPQPLQSSIPQPDMDDQIATDHLIPRGIDVSLGLGDAGVAAVSEAVREAGGPAVALDHEEFARAHPNTTFHSEPTEGVVQPFTITGLKGRHITSTIFHSNSAPATVLMTAPQATVISQAPDHSVKYEIENMINSMPSSHNNDINLSSVLVKDDGLTRFDNILTDSRELHLTNTASAIVHSSGNATQVIRRVCYEDDKRERDARYLIDEPDNLIAGDDAKMIAEDSSRDATLESMADVDDDRSSPERHAELFWESNSASERSESRRPLDFSSDSDKCCKSPSFDENNSTDSSGVGTHLRLDSVIKEARSWGSLDGSSAEEAPPLRTYPAKRPHAPAERSVSGKTRAGERAGHERAGHERAGHERAGHERAGHERAGHERAGHEAVRRRASGRGVVKRGCHCCNGEPAPPRPKKPRQRKPTLDFHATN